MLAALAVIAPMFFLGNVSGHDFGFHIASWMDAAGQWREGIAYPRWAEWANWGFGEPRFIFYPPASWIAGAALGSLLPWKIVPGALIWISLAIAGMCMWKLAREWLPAHTAILAGGLYAVNPYHLLIVYQRSAFGELLADALYPLLILAAWRVLKRRWRAVPLLAIVFAAIWISNAPAAVIATYLLVLIFVVGSIAERHWESLIPAGVGAFWGLSLAAFYILPAAWGRQWVQIAQATVDELRPSVNFIFSRSNTPEYLAFNSSVSWIGAIMIIATAIALTAALKEKVATREVRSILIAIAVAATFLMLPLSLLIWETFPELNFVQFPWRCLGLIAVVLAFAIAAALGYMRNGVQRWSVVGVVFLCFAGAGAKIASTAWWDTADIPDIASAIRSGAGYAGTDEYSPIGSDRYALPGNPDETERNPGVSGATAPRIAAMDKSGEPIGTADVNIDIERWSAEKRVFTERASLPATLAIRLLDYPAWRVRVNGKKATKTALEDTGQLAVSVPAGENHIEILFRRTRDGVAGDVITLASVLILIGVWWRERRRISKAAGA